MHGQAARDADGLAGDVGGVVRQKERDQAGIILRLSEPSHRNRALEPFGDRGLQARQLLDVLVDTRVVQLAKRAQDLVEVAWIDVLRRKVEGEASAAALSGTDDVPTEFKALVEQYYRSLARSK